MNKSESVQCIEMPESHRLVKQFLRERGDTSDLERTTDRNGAQLVHVPLAEWELWSERISARALPAQIEPDHPRSGAVQQRSIWAKVADELFGEDSFRNAMGNYCSIPGKRRSGGPKGRSDVVPGEAELLIPADSVAARARPALTARERDARRIAICAAFAEAWKMPRRNPSAKRAYENAARILQKKFQIDVSARHVKRLIEDELTPEDRVMWFRALHLTGSARSKEILSAIASIEAGRPTRNRRAKRRGD